MNSKKFLSTNYFTDYYYYISVSVNNVELSEEKMMRLLP